MFTPLNQQAMLGIFFEARYLQEVFPCFISSSNVSSIQHAHLLQSIGSQTVQISLARRS